MKSILQLEVAGFDPPVLAFRTVGPETRTLRAKKTGIKPTATHVIP